METIGQKLRKARDQKDITVEEAHIKTKILQRFIFAMELDRFQDVGSPVYAKGFLKKYSQFLGLNTDEIINEYENLYPSSQEVKIAYRSEQIMEETKKKIFSPQIIIIASGAVLVILVAVLIIWLASHKKKSSTDVASAAKKTVVQLQKEANLLVPKTEALRLLISTKDDVWMQAKCDGKVMFENILPKGGTKKLQAQNEFELWLGKADAVSLDLNGNILGSPGKGTVKGIKVTREGIK